MCACPAGNFYTDELAMQSNKIKDEERQSESPSTEQQSEPSPLILPPPEPKMLKQVLLTVLPLSDMHSIKNLGH